MQKAEDVSGPAKDSTSAKVLGHSTQARLTDDAAPFISLAEMQTYKERMISTYQADMRYDRSLGLDGKYLLDNARICDSSDDRNFIPNSDLVPDT